MKEDQPEKFKSGPRRPRIPTRISREAYLNAGVGQSKYDVSQSDLDDAVLSAFEESGVIVGDADSRFDDKGDSWSVSGGYRFSKHFAVEVGYVDLGTTEYRAGG